MYGRFLEGEKSGIIKGEAIGIVKGEAIGVLKGESAMLIRLIKHKFGAISPEQESKIKQANAEKLLEWGDRILEAKTIDDIFVSAHQDVLI